MRTETPSKLRIGGGELIFNKIGRGLGHAISLAGIGAFASAVKNAFPEGMIDVQVDENNRTTDIIVGDIRNHFILCISKGGLTTKTNMQGVKGGNLENAILAVGVDLIDAEYDVISRIIAEDKANKIRNSPEEVARRRILQEAKANKEFLANFIFKEGEEMIISRDLGGWESQTEDTFMIAKRDLTPEDFLSACDADGNLPVELMEEKGLAVDIPKHSIMIEGAKNRIEAAINKRDKNNPSMNI